MKDHYCPKRATGVALMGRRETEKRRPCVVALQAWLPRKLFWRWLAGQHSSPVSIANSQSVSRLYFFLPCRRWRTESSQYCSASYEYCFPSDPRTAGKVRRVAWQTLLLLVTSPRISSPGRDNNAHASTASSFSSRLHPMESFSADDLRNVGAFKPGATLQQLHYCTSPWL